MSLRDLAKGLMLGGQGLKLAGGIGSPEAFQANVNQEQQQARFGFAREQDSEQRKNLLIGLLISARERGAIDGPRFTQAIQQLDTGGGFSAMSGVGEDPRLKDQHEAAMTNASLRNEELQRKIAKDDREKRAEAGRASLNKFFDVIQGGGSEQQAQQQAQLVHTSQLQAMGLQPEQFNPQQMPIPGGDGEEEGGFIQAGGVEGFGQPGEFIQTAKKKNDDGMMPQSPPMWITPQEQQGQPPATDPAQKAPANYNWQLAYLYTANRLPKYNPATAEFVLDWKTGQPMENEPRTKSMLARAKATASNVQVGNDFGKPAENKIEADMLAASNAKRRMESIRSAVDPSFLTISKKVESLIAAGKEKLGFKLSDEDQAALAKITKFKRKTMANLNLTIKEMTGAQMNQAEAERLIKMMPNLDDSYTEFKTKMEDVLEELQATLEAHEEARHGGPSSLVGDQSQRPTQKPAQKQKPAGPAIDFKELK